MATMSHEIRTPMNGMIGMLELLGLGPLDDRQRQMLAVIAGSGQSLLRIIDDVLDFSKVEAGKLELHEEVASVANIVEDIRNIHSPVASSKGLALTATLDPRQRPAMWVDPLRLRQILNNLVSNAVKFTAAGGIEIGVEVLETDGARQLLRLSVTDTGVGISPEDQQRLFQPFVQVGGAGGGAWGGTGLGLAISRQLAALMQGSIALRSAPGQGTTLSLVIPVRTAETRLLSPTIEARLAELRQATRGMRPAPSEAAAEAEGSLVLVVDDHPVNRMLLQEQLATLGYAAEAVQDAAEGLQRWNGGRFALVLTDCQMPGMDGYELTRRIRAAEAAAGRGRTPVIACTAMALPDQQDRCRAAGMDDIVFKPVELGTLLATMRRWLPLSHGAARGPDGDPPNPDRAPAAGAVDIRLLEATWGSDAGNIQAVLAAYARSVSEDSGDLRDALARRDAQGLVHVTHRMLGASKMVGAHALAESCALLNAAARDGNWQRVVDTMQAVDAETARVLAELDRRE
jgi:CheY-like chemotaxis protein/HPt (histidine-containing phosphotransfer) domain-containing protein/two-component sensor histidine kinase